MSNKFTFYVNIWKMMDGECPVMTNAEAGLDWYARVKVVKSTLNKAHLSAFLYCRNPNLKFQNYETWKYKTAVKMTLVNLNSSDPTVGFTRQCFATFEEKTMRWGWEKFMAFDDFLKGDYVKDNQAWIRIEIDPGVTSVPPEGGLTTAPVEKKKMSFHRFGKVLNVVLVSKDGMQVKAHRDILIAGSPVFATMLESVRKTSWISNIFSGTMPEVPLPDVTSDCLLTMLEHIYGAPLSKLDHSPLTFIQELLPAAHKYELKDLKAYCGQLLVARATPGNVLQLYKMIQKYSMNEASKGLEEYMKSNISEVLDQAFLASTKRDADEN